MCHHEIAQEIRIRHPEDESTDEREAEEELAETPTAADD